MGYIGILFPEQQSRVAAHQKYDDDTKQHKTSQWAKMFTIMHIIIWKKGASV